MNIRSCVFSALAVMLSFLSPLGAAGTFVIGDSRTAVVDCIGQPLREQRSPEGTLLVYSNSLVYLIDDKVDFISLGPPQLVNPKENAPPAEPSPVAAAASAATTPHSESAHAYRDHPVFAQAVQRQHDDMRAASRNTASLSAYWTTLRENFAQNSLFDSPGGMLTLKTADGHTIPATGEARKPAWHYLDVALDEILLTEEDAP